MACRVGYESRIPFAKRLRGFAPARSSFSVRVWVYMCMYVAALEAYVVALEATMCESWGEASEDRNASEPGEVHERVSAPQHGRLR